jgi:hypothetical protein
MRKAQNVCTHLLSHAPLPARLPRLHEIRYATVHDAHLGQLNQQRPRRRGDVSILPGWVSAIILVSCLLVHSYAPSLRRLRSLCLRLLPLPRRRQNPSLRPLRSGHTSRRYLVRGRVCRVAEDGLGMAVGLQGISAPCPTPDWRNYDGDGHSHLAVRHALRTSALLFPFPLQCDGDTLIVPVSSRTRLDELAVGSCVEGNTAEDEVGSAALREPLRCVDAAEDVCGGAFLGSSRDRARRNWR